MAKTETAIELLEQQHRQVERLLEEVQECDDAGTLAEPEGRRRLDEVVALIRAHTQLEEELMYPAIRDATGNEVQFHISTEEHRLVERELVDLESGTPGTAAFTAKLNVMTELLLTHVAEEEESIFPQAGKAIGKTKLKELGEQLEARAHALLGAEDSEDEQTSGGKIDLNSADLQHLESIEGIDEGRANKIIEERQRRGRFSSWEDLAEIEGLGEATVNKLRQQATLGQHAKR